MATEREPQQPLAHEEVGLFASAPDTIKGILHTPSVQQALTLLEQSDPESANDIRVSPSSLRAASFIWERVVAVSLQERLGRFAITPVEFASHVITPPEDSRQEVHVYAAKIGRVLTILEEGRQLLGYSQADEEEARILSNHERESLESDLRALALNLHIDGKLGPGVDAANATAEDVLDAAIADVAIEKPETLQAFNEALEMVDDQRVFDAVAVRVNAAVEESARILQTGQDFPQSLLSDFATVNPNTNPFETALNDVNDLASASGNSSRATADVMLQLAIIARKDTIGDLITEIEVANLEPGERYAESVRPMVEAIRIVKALVKEETYDTLTPSQRARIIHLARRMNRPTNGRSDREVFFDLLDSQFGVVGQADDPEKERDELERALETLEGKADIDAESVLTIDALPTYRPSLDALVAQIPNHTGRLRRWQHFVDAGDYIVHMGNKIVDVKVTRETGLSEVVKKLKPYARL